MLKALGRFLAVTDPFLDIYEFSENADL